jgi:hypothetical protein
VDHPETAAHKEAQRGTHRTRGPWTEVERWQLAARLMRAHAVEPTHAQGFSFRSTRAQRVSCILSGHGAGHVDVSIVW